MEYPTFLVYTGQSEMLTMKASSGRIYKFRKGIPLPVQEEDIASIAAYQETSKGCSTCPGSANRNKTLKPFQVDANYAVISRTDLQSFKKHWWNYYTTHSQQTLKDLGF